MSKIAQIVSNIGKSLVGGVVDKASTLVDSVGDIVFKKKELEIEVQKLVHEYQAKLLDAANEDSRIQAETLKAAYDREARINESEHSSKLSKNITSILAILIVFFTFVYGLILIYKSFDEKASDIVLSFVELLKTLTVLVIGYYFGSSSGSKQKSEVISRYNESRKNSPENI